MSIFSNNINFNLTTYILNHVVIKNSYNIMQYILDNYKFNIRVNIITRIMILNKAKMLEIILNKYIDGCENYVNCPELLKVAIKNKKSEIIIKLFYYDNISIYPNNNRKSLDDEIKYLVGDFNVNIKNIIINHQ